MSSFAPVYFGSDGLPVEYGSTDDLTITGRLAGSYIQSNYHNNATAGNAGTTYFAGGTASASRTDGACIALGGVNASGFAGAASYFVGATGANSQHRFFDKNLTQQFLIDESGAQFTQYVSGGASGLLVYSNRSSNAVALYLSGGSQTTGFSTSAGALIQLAGSGGSGHALYYTATTSGASHYFYDKTATAQARIYEGGLLVYGGFGMAGIGPVGRQTGGALSAAATYAANEQSMLNKVYLAMQAFGLLT